MTPRSRATVTGRIKEPQTLSSLVSRWGHRLLVAHQRNSVFSELRQSLLDRIHSAICSTPSSVLRRCNPSDEGWPAYIYRVASRRRRKEMTSRDWQLTHQRLPYRAGIAEAPTQNPAGPRRRDDEWMIKLRRKKLIVCDRVDKNGAMAVKRSRTKIIHVHVR